MNCANTTKDVVLMGNPVLDGTPMGTNEASYTFMVKACPEMNSIRELLNKPLIDCADEIDITAAHNTFTTLVASVH
jgi:hypothetical protein